jgi:hypothetical protein
MRQSGSGGRTEYSHSIGCSRYGNGPSLDYLTTLIRMTEWIDASQAKAVSAVDEMPGRVPGAWCLVAVWC